MPPDSGGEEITRWHSGSVPRGRINSHRDTRYDYGGLTQAGSVLTLYCVTSLNLHNYITDGKTEA